MKTYIWRSSEELLNYGNANESGSSCDEHIFVTIEFGDARCHRVCKI